MARNGYGHSNGSLPPKGGRRRGRKRPVPLPPPAPPAPPAQTQALSPLDPSPQRRFRDLQEQIRLGIWDEWQASGYTPWCAMMAMALAADTPLELRFQCHRELAQYVLAKLKAMEVSGEVEHHHTSEPLQVLFARLEQEEEAERASLPPWTPPGLGALDMRRSEDGEWDLEDSEDNEGTN